MNERTMPGGSGDERSLLDGWLDYYRAALLAKCEGLTGDQLVARSCEPSPMSLIGLVRHMTRWSGCTGTGWPTGAPACCTAPTKTRTPTSAVTAAVRRKTWRHSARTAPGPGKSWPRTNSTTPSVKRTRTRVRWCLYLIKEYARHLGHADLLRERIDGVTGE